MWSCIGRALRFLIRDKVATLLECVRCEGIRTADASLFKIALTVGRLCSANRGEEISNCGPAVTDSFWRSGGQVTPDLDECFALIWSDRVNTAKSVGMFL